jgi:hypothetical protein
MEEGFCMSADSINADHQVMSILDAARLSPLMVWRAHPSIAVR